MAYWLMKSEPAVYGIDDLQRDGRTRWEGIRNYQVRNMMRDDMRRGDLAFFCHSSCAEPGIAGTMSISAPARPDPTQFDRSSEYFDAASDPAEPRWLLVDVKFVSRFSRVIPLPELRLQPALSGMLLLRPGNRLSVTPVTSREWKAIMKLAGNSP
jgi:predicted RNA-binding protein with PUA-like domain